MASVATKTELVLDDGETAAFEAIRDFLSGSATLGGGEIITEDTSLLESGILDSIGILQLMTFLSEKLGVEISDEDFVAENFRTIGSLARLITEKRRPHAG